LTTHRPFQLPDVLAFDPAAGPLRIQVRAERWPLAEPFVISRGVKTAAEVVVVTANQGGARGHGECVPYARYGESVASVRAEIATACERAEGGDPRPLMTPGAARNAVDCALWDLAAKRTGRRAAELVLGRPQRPLETCFTLSLGEPEAMAAKAASVPQLKLLKLKLGGAGDDARMAAVRRARPDARLVADANEAWTVDMVAELLRAAAAAGVEVIEQPLPAGGDAMLRTLPRPRGVLVCADESAHTAEDVAALADRYDAVNIKLDKTGGLTAALEMAAAACAAGLEVMAGCMVATSLAMAPALIVGELARWVDLDGPLLLAADREHGIVIAGGLVMPPSALLWG
jgi:L-alanine-DL-glutamate epimerase-like enolase superfamily enzyme